MKRFRSHAVQELVLLLTALSLSPPGEAASSASPANAPLPRPDRPARQKTLDECLTIALQNSRRRPASRFAVAAAEAQHRQALAGYWPHLHLKGGYQRMDEAPNFLFPATTMGVPAQTVTTPPGTAYIELPPGFAGPNAVQVPMTFPGQSITTAAQEFPIPAQEVRLADPDSLVGSLDATWLIFDGGMRSGYRQQSRALVAAMKEEVRRTDLELSWTVKRYYYGSVLAGQLHQLGKDTLARLEATLQLTETMYQNGAGGKVTKADFLDNKIMVESLRSVVALLEKNEAMARAALANSMGMPWQDSIEPASAEIPFEPSSAKLEDTVEIAYEFSPDWNKIEAALQAAEGAIKTARSGFYPKVALTGGVHKWWNDYRAGMATDENKEGWSVGVVVDMPIFEGFLTQNKVAETRAKLAQLKEQRFLLKEGIGLQIKEVFLGLAAARKAHDATLSAMHSAAENRDLNVRAYQNELVDTEDVIRAQVVEALMTAQHLQTRFEHISHQLQLTMLVGSEVLKQLQNFR